MKILENILAIKTVAAEAPYCCRTFELKADKADKFSSRKFVSTLVYFVPLWKQNWLISNIIKF